MREPNTQIFNINTIKTTEKTLGFQLERKHCDYQQALNTFLKTMTLQEFFYTLKLSR